jgi:5-methylcytosine-specific restriction endonuclease McrA
MSDILQEINDLCEDYAKSMLGFEQQLKEMKIAHTERMLNLVCSYNDYDARLYVASLVYVMDKNVIGNDLLKALGIEDKGSKFYLYAVPVIFTRFCDQCNGEFDIEISTRNSVNYDRFGRIKGVAPYRKTCQNCKGANNYSREKSDEYMRSAQLEIERLKRLPYKEYLKTEHWNNTRQRALKRAYYRCALCNSNGQLHVHHRTYENIGKEHNADLIVLCSHCHAKFHDKLEEQKS